MPEHAHLCVHTRQARQDAVKSNNAEERRQRATLVNDAAHLDSNARARTRFRPGSACLAKPPDDKEEDRRWLRQMRRMGA
ncbi:unnamed protein product [Clonostachys chloroleuca]|uniref:Uncharacterized protein n=1 Tax=Clonostachys chloroleuca TaxID=1926264 RepID=A0AA35VJF3_9HYPO|nr:unnamed protein product [Clonostachys chloroleuca]